MRHAWLVLLLGACGQAGTSDTAAHFIPLQKDFTGFRQWHAYDLGVQPADSVHPAGRRTVYLNHLPPTGSTQFPAGTMLAKTVDKEDGTLGNIFAMAKRGGSYNSQGAVGWEWFELQDNSDSSDGSELIVWRGITPPTGEGYGGDVVGGACNTCHGLHADNDFVTSSALLLSGF
jgi:hypothetical protein